MKKTVLKSARKINRKPLKHAKKSDIMENRFENLEGPIETQHLLILTFPRFFGHGIELLWCSTEEGQQMRSVPFSPNSFSN